MIDLEIDLPANNWGPRPYQQNAWDYLKNGGKRAVIVWPRRSGKDEICLHRTAIAAMERPAVYWHMLPQANQARKAIWAAVNPHTGKRRIDEAFPHELRSNTRENEMSIQFVNGSLWQVVGSDNFNALVGSPPAGIVFSEWSLSNPHSWNYLRPILAENGGWAIFIFTPRGKNHGYKSLEAARKEPGWFHETLTVDDTKVIPQAVLDEERREMIRLHGEDEGSALFNQEYYCSFDAPLVGSIYGSHITKAMRDKRIIQTIPHEPSIPVYTAWDLGMDDLTAIWFFQMVGPEIRFLHYLEGHNRALTDYVVEMQELASTNRWVWGEHFLPHDVEVRELGTGKSRREVLENTGLKVKTAPRRSLNDGIELVRQLFPKFWFGESQVEKGLEALKSYHREWDADLRAYSREPAHDWSSHAADAIRTMALCLPTVTTQTASWGQPIKYPKRSYV